MAGLATFQRFVLTKDAPPPGSAPANALGSTYAIAHRRHRALSRYRIWRGKVLGGYENGLSRAEKESLRYFRQVVGKSNSPKADQTKVGFADRILKRRKIHTETSAISDTTYVQQDGRSAQYGPHNHAIRMEPTNHL
ncbi:hypothetical protein L914_01733 [Phytophthora nicotianae]|uniref:Uncharacterized protein n=1 Tax=Phytophthora nicotianae TaxID=4792 RepID=W2P1W2_PHYNI|nr:hypothetical protein L914_01733 [Phytophthora nicotianae]